MSAQHAPIDPGSPPGPRRALHGSRFLTTPSRDPLGLAAEIYFGRTGRTDYALRLSYLEDPAVVHDGVDISDEAVHPFQFIKVEQGRYNARVAWVQSQVANPALYRACRHRWYWNQDPTRAQTPACMAIWCPGCWMTKVERAYEALSAARAPIYGVITADLTLSDVTRDCLTERSRIALVGATTRLSAREQDRCWRPLYWALFPIPGAPEPQYRFAGIFVAAQPLQRKACLERTPSELQAYGVPRELETTAGHTLAWERSFEGPDRAQAAWHEFRRATPAPVMASSEDGSCPGYSDGDAIRAEGETVTWKQTQRAYRLNLLRYRELPQEPSAITEPCLDPETIAEVYGDAREAHRVYLTQARAFRDALRHP